MDSFLNAFLKRVTYQCLLDVEHRISLPTLIKALSFYKEMHALKGSLPVPHDQIELTLNLSRDFESLVRGGLSAVAKAKKQKALREERRRFRRRSFY